MQGVVGILLMGGSGTRFGSDMPKQFHRLSGKKVYLHTLEQFLKPALFDEILLVTHPEWIEEVKEDIKNYPGAPIRVISGGATRQESSYHGLVACAPHTHLVVIHDAVRPFVSERILKENIESALQFGAADTCIPSADTIVHAPDGANIDSIPQRKEYLRGQTPQSFSFPIIFRAHEETALTNASDDCSLVIDMGRIVHVVAGEERNIKITTELDLFLADQLIRMEQVQLGTGNNSLQGKRFAITGGTGGIGGALARLLEQEGAIPLLISRNSQRYPFDLAAYGNVQNAFTRIHEEHGPLDGLINCMGMLKVKEVGELTPDEIEELIAVNLAGPIFCCKCVTLKEGSHLINVGSSSYSRGRRNYAVYSSAKAALVNFTQGLAEERPHLKINAIVPGRTNTKMRQEQFPEEEQDDLLQPDEVAKAILSLLKQEALTGAIVKI